MGIYDNNKGLIDPSRIENAMDEASKEWKEAQKCLADALAGVKDLYKNNAETTKNFANALKDYKNPSGDFQNWYSGGSDKKRVKLSSLGFLEEQDDDGFLGDVTDKMSGRFSSELQKMLMGYSDFSTSMKRIGADMMNYLVKSAIDGIMQTVFAQQNARSTLGIVGSLFGFGGNALQGAGGFLANIFKHHSGGIAPSGANYSLPGSKEQLALLKGGERVLSPSENVSYESQGGSSPVVFNNFNVKAWDSKDVSKYLLENKQLLNSITFEGIKNNNSHLRTIVQNA